MINHKRAIAYVKKHQIFISTYNLKMVLVCDIDMLHALHLYYHSLHPQWTIRDKPNSKGMSYFGPTFFEGEVIRGVLVFIDPKWMTRPSIRTKIITHELGHVALDVCGGIRYNPVREQEPFCYLLGDLCGQAQSWVENIMPTLVKKEPV